MFKKTNFPPVFLYLFFIFIIVFLLGSLGVVKPLRSFTEKSMILPLKQKLYDLKLISNKNQRENQCQQCKSEAELKVKIASLEEENREQKRLLSSPLPKNWQFLEVKIIDYKNESLTIDKGAEDGVKEGMIAVDGNTFLGTVRKAVGKMSTIRMPTYPDEKYVVKIIDKDGEITGKGLLVGTGVGKMKIEQILPSENVQKGNLVSVNLEGGELLVGEIDEVVIQKDELFKTSSVTGLNNLQDLNTIFLVRGRL